MSRLPERPHFEHLKKQARVLLREYLAGRPEALERFRQSLPAAQGKDDAAIAALNLALHDAQSALAREYGFPSWRQLQEHVKTLSAESTVQREDALARWLHAVYGHDNERPRPVAAARALELAPGLADGDFYLACTIGNKSRVVQEIQKDPGCVNRMGAAWVCPVCEKPVRMPPLVAMTHSSLLRLDAFRDRLRGCARLLLDAGADPNQSFESDGHPLSALYGVAGKNHDVELTRMLLGAGANPNDGESLYHSMESESTECARLLLEAGATVEGSNALHHCLDGPDLEKLRLLLGYTKDANDAASGIGRPLVWAIRRGRSREHVEALLAAGADPHAKNKEGISAYRLAMQMGLTDVANVLRAAGAGEELEERDRFVAACAAANEAEANRMLAANPMIIDSLSEAQLRQLPQLVESGNHAAVRLMVKLGWPIAVRGGDWGASALNHAVYQGNPELARFLLEHGASWEEEHNFGDNVHGTLQWASRNMGADPGRDYVGCAKALIEHGLPILDLRGDYSEAVGAFLNAERAKLEAIRKVQAAIEAGDAGALRRVVTEAPFGANAIIPWGPSGKNHAHPLHYVCDMTFQRKISEVQAMELTETLLAAGANVNHHQGETPLHGAASLGVEEVGVRLLEAGADPNALGSGGETPLHWAAHLGMEKLVKRMLQAGAATDLRDTRYNGTPLDWAEHGLADRKPGSLGQHEAVIALLGEKA